MVRVLNTSDRDGKGGKEEYLTHPSAHPTILGGSESLARMNNYGKKAHKEHEDAMKDIRASQQPSIPNIVLSVHDDMI